MECSKSNGVCLKVLTTNLDCKKKLTKSTFACGSPMQLSQTSFLFSQNVLTKSAWSQLDTETNTFVREVFGQQTFFCQQGNLQNWCWQQDVLNQARSCAQDSWELSLPKWERESLLAMNFAPFLEFIFFSCNSICMGILAMRRHSNLDWNNCSPSSLRNSLIQPNHDYWLLLSWILKVFWDISFSQWPRRFLTKHFL